jgi:hypothetical protein
MIMPRRYDTYGFKGSSLEEAAVTVEDLLGVELEQRESSYRGIYYCAGKTHRRDLLLYKNAGSNPAFTGYSVILDVNLLSNMDEIQSKLTARGEVVLLETKVLPDPTADHQEE